MKLQCWFIRVLLYLCLSIQIGFFLLAWSPWQPSLGPWAIKLAAKGMGYEEARLLSTSARWLGVALGLPALLTMCYGLWRLDRMLVGWQRPDIFSLAAVGHLRAFAGATLLSVLLAIVETPLRGYLLLSGAPPHRLNMGVSSEALMLIFTCTVFYLIASVMHEGRRLAEENQGFV